MRVCIRLVAFAIASFLATEAQAGVTILRPFQGECAVCDNSAENATLNNSGHFAMATGLPPGHYVWITSTDPSATNDAKLADIQYVSGYHGDTIRYMPFESKGIARDWQPFYLIVYNTNDSNDRDYRQIYPVKVSWILASDYKDDDRLVHDTLTTDTEDRIRTIRFRAWGRKPIADLRIRTFWDIPPHEIGTGRLDFSKYDDGTIPVAPVDPPVLLGAAIITDEWQIAGVTTAAGDIQTGGREHVLEMNGAALSAYKDDIELNLCVHQIGIAALPVRNFDGTGASIKYTVCLLDLIVGDLTESEEESEGQYLYVGVEGEGAEQIAAVVDEISPPMSDYRILIDGDLADPPQVLLLEDESPFSSKNVPTTPAYSFDVKASELSESERDAAVRITLRNIQQTEERGGGTCRDQAKVTVFEVKLKTATFGGSGYCTLYDDDGSFGDVGEPIEGPHILEEEDEKPILYVAESAPTVSAEFETSPAISTAVSARLRLDAAEGPLATLAYDAEVVTFGSTEPTEATFEAQSGDNFASKMAWTDLYADWKVSFDDGETFTKFTTTVNPLYVVAAAPPQGAGPTVTRIDMLTQACKNRAINDVAGIIDDLWRYGGASSSSGAIGQWEYATASSGGWSQFDGSPGYCIEIVQLLGKMVEMVGLGSANYTIVALLPDTDGNFIEFDKGKSGATVVPSSSKAWRQCSEGSSEHPEDTTHDDWLEYEYLTFVDTNDQLNQFEACFKYCGESPARYYAGGLGTSYWTSPEDLLAFGFKETVWLYWPQKGVTAVCSDPGPDPEHLW